MRAPFFRLFGIAVLVLMAAFAAPANAYAAGDSDQIMTIGTAPDIAVVRVRVVNGQTYLAVRSGTLVLRYDNGKEMARVPAGTTMMVSGFKGSVSNDGSGLRLGSLYKSRFGKKVKTTLKIALSAKSPPLQITAIKGGRSTTLSPGMKVTERLKIKRSGGRLSKKTKIKKATFSSQDDVSGTERDLLSETN